jgi:hypothetical protein
MTLDAEPIAHEAIKALGEYDYECTTTDREREDHAKEIDGLAEQVRRAGILHDDLQAIIADLKAEVLKWKRIRTPTHGQCCTCQACGLDYDHCRCDLDELAWDVADLRRQNKALAEHYVGSLGQELLRLSGENDDLRKRIAELEEKQKPSPEEVDNDYRLGYRPF